MSNVKTKFKFIKFNLKPYEYKKVSNSFIEKFCMQFNIKTKLKKQKIKFRIEFNCIIQKFIKKKNINKYK